MQTCKLIFHFWTIEGHYLTIPKTDTGGGLGGLGGQSPPPDFLTKNFLSPPVVTFVKGEKLAPLSPSGEYCQRGKIWPPPRSWVWSEEENSPPPPVVSFVKKIAARPYTSPPIVSFVRRAIVRGGNCPNFSPLHHRFLYPSLNDTSLRPDD